MIVRGVGLTCELDDDWSRRQGEGSGPHRQNSIPVTTSHQNKCGSMLGHRGRRWTNVMQEVVLSNIKWYNNNCMQPLLTDINLTYSSGAILSYTLRYIVGFGLVEMAISTNPKPTIYRNLYENTGHVRCFFIQSLHLQPGLQLFSARLINIIRCCWEWNDCLNINI